MAGGGGGGGAKQVRAPTCSLQHADACTRPQPGPLPPMPPSPHAHTDTPGRAPARALRRTHLHHGCADAGHRVAHGLPPLAPLRLAAAAALPALLLVHDEVVHLILVLTSPILRARTAPVRAAPPPLPCCWRCSSRLRSLPTPTPPPAALALGRPAAAGRRGAGCTATLRTAALACWRAIQLILQVCKGRPRWGRRGVGVGGGWEECTWCGMALLRALSMRVERR